MVELSFHENNYNLMLRPLRRIMAYIPWDITFTILMREWFKGGLEIEYSGLISFQREIIEYSD